MLGEQIAHGAGKVTLQRVLPDPQGIPKMETTFQGSGALLGVNASEVATYTTALRADGSLFGDGQGIVTSAEGDVATWSGQGVGTLKNDGTVSMRGAVYVQTASPKWARLNTQAVVFEFEVDAQGQTRSKSFEWK